MLTCGPFRLYRIFSILVSLICTNVTIASARFWESTGDQDKCCDTFEYAGSPLKPWSSNEIIQIYDIHNDNLLSPSCKQEALLGRWPKLVCFSTQSIFPLYHVMLVGKDDDPSRCSLLAFLPANQVAPSPNAGLSLAGSPPRTPGSLYSTVRTYTVLRWISVVLHCGITVHRHFCSSLQQISWALRVSGVVGHCVVNAWNFCKLHCVALLCPALPECTTFPCLPCFAMQITC